MPSINNDQRGSVDRLTIPLVLAIILLFVAIIFGVWAYSGRQNYKNNANQAIAIAVAAAQKQQMTTDAVSYNAAQEKPLQNFSGPAEFGSLLVAYPKTWSAYVAVASAGDSGSMPINGYFQPGVIPDVQNPNNVFALRVAVLQQSYDQVVQNFDSQAQAQQVTVMAYSLPKVPNDVGVMVKGAIEQNKQGTMVVLPLRDTTLEIWTESASYEGDFNNTILPNLSFSP